MVDDLARPVPNPESAFDDDLGDPVDDDDKGRDRDEEEVAAGAAQWAATLTTLTVSSCPSILSVSRETPSGPWPRATATASVSVAM